MAGLLPTHHDEFRTKEYWDKFFLERQEAAFEWYGNYSDMSQQLDTKIQRKDSLLIIGCGNSDFSSQIYDKGYNNIRNLDFSELVISEMRGKNQQARPSMHWDVGDMTDMNAYTAEQFDVVFDKGALDALMSVESSEVLKKALDMFREIDRVLSSSGRYICVTLAEPYILKTLISAFTESAATSSHWTVSVEALSIDKPSPFKPLLFTIQKMAGTTGKIDVFVDQLGNPLDTPQSVLPHEIAQKISAMQSLYQKSFDLRHIKVGRFECFEVFSPVHKDIPRFSITIVDADNTATLSCAVLFLPSGREAEYQFSTQGGLEALAAQANCRRLLAVRCNRPHVFPSNPVKLQDELDSVVLSLKPSCCTSEEKIPYMAVAADDAWDTIARGESALSGKYIIEESECEGAHSHCVLRRLIFLQNQNFIQTELRLSEKRAGAKSSKRGTKGTGSMPSKGKKGNDGDGKEFDHTYMDAHHCTVLAGMTLCPAIIRGAMRGSTSAASNSSQAVTGLVIGLGGGAMPMCLQRYLPEMKLFICDIDSELEGVARTHFGFRSSDRSIVVIEEGMHLLHTLRHRIDPSVAVTTSSINEGASIHAELCRPLDFVFVDVDSKDPSLGMSAPPRAFASKEALETMHAVLKPGAMLAINVAARSSSMMHEFLTVLYTVFVVQAPIDSRGRIFTVRGSEDLVNVTVIALRGGASVLAGTVPSKSKASSDKALSKATKLMAELSLEGRHASERQARESDLDDWLRASGLQSDPLELGSCISKLEEVFK